ncbi:MAG TPA: very short patch repair endonuclease [bacterium]|nr:very short patch repair endonuclease [bacterium]HPQ65695.1 very short patch repair endonuclease [bacterium]
MEVRRTLFGEGFRYRLHARNLPGRPDIVLAGHKTVVFVHGCYWHGHECGRRPKAKSNQQFWNKKIKRNRLRDLCVRGKLLDMGWRVLVIWECAVRRRTPAFGEGRDVKRIATWIRRGGRLAILSEDGFEECL